MKKRAQKRKKGIDMLGVTFFVFIAAVIGVLCVALYYQQTKASPGEPSTRVIKKTEEQLKSELTFTQHCMLLAQVAVLKTISVI